VDAEAAARDALNGDATTLAKTQEGPTESIRALRIVFTSARRDRVRVILLGVITSCGPTLIYE
jgi:hypothetical protein